MADLTEAQRDTLIRTILGEARGEGDTGMAAVAQVIFNRANSGDFPSDPAKVAKQKNQFSVWNGNSSLDKFGPGSSGYKKAGEIVDQVAGGLIPDLTGGALYYHNPSVSPGWAKHVDQYGEVKLGNHVFYPNHPVPPGSLPEVATLLDTKQTPSKVTPATPTPDMQQMRNPATSIAAQRAQVTPPMPVPRPSHTPANNLVADSFAALPQRSSNLGDQLGMNPIQGGKQTAPLFDAAYDTRTGEMRMRREPETVSSQGMGMGTSTAPAPVPKTASLPLQSARVANSAVDPGLQAALAAQKPRTLLPVIPPSTIGQPPTERLVHSVPVPATQTNLAGMMGRGLPTPAPDRLAASPSGLPALYGSVSPHAVSGMGVGLGNNVNTAGLRVTVPNPILTAKVAPTPLMRPGFGEGGVDINAPANIVRAPVQPTVRIAAPLQRNPVSMIFGGNKAPAANLLAAALMGQSSAPRPSTQSILDITDSINGRANGGQTRSSSVSW